MADEPSEIENDIADQSGMPELKEVKEKKPEPAYRVMGPKIVVSKAFGANCKAKKESALKSLEPVREAWDEAYRYYNHDQVKETTDRAQARAGHWWRRGDSYENVVFSNVSVMVPSIYAKNPDVYFETDQDEDKEFVQVLSVAINALFNKQEPYGVNLKPRMKKATLHAELTNLGVVKLDYQEKSKEWDLAQDAMIEIVDKLKKAKDKKEVAKLEGQMMALESNMEYMQPAGFKVSTVVPTNLIIDPFAENDDASDAQWMFEETYLPTNYLNAKFTKEVGGEKRSLYKPTHKLKTDGEGGREDALGMALEAIEEGTGDQDSHMDEDRQNYIYENMTKCWWYWDKPSRRLYLYQDCDWTWPVWVWEDPMKTSRFFPYYFIQFYPSTGGVCSPGEVSFYLDQQDEINEINRMTRRARRNAFNIVCWNSSVVDPDDAKKLINYLKYGIGDNAFGINVPEGQTINDCLETIAPPSLKFEALFNKQAVYSAIDKIGSVSDAIRGQEFRTNTTEDAVQAYTSAAQLRLGNRTDAIEECIQQLSWGIAEILVTRGDENMIRGLVGDRLMSKWKQMDLVTFNADYSVQVAAGSSEKPTSVFKQQEAIQIAQAMGQFAQAAPGSTLKVVMKLLKGAFPELQITEEDWAAIDQEMAAVLQRGVSTGGPGGPAAPGGPPQQGAMPPQAGGAPAMDPAQIEQLLASLPPEAQQMVIQRVEAGEDPLAVVQELMQ